MKRAAEEILTLENKGKDKELSIVLVGADRMRKLNKKYRAKNRVTDVLSFAPPAPPDLGEPAEKEKDNSVLGEIVICLREVNKNAKKNNLSFEKELTNCLIHGLLHLLGYDHGPAQTQDMLKKQEEYLLKVFDNAKKPSHRWS